MKKRSGFTLAEVLIAVGIIGIIAAIVMPYINVNIEETKETAAKDTLRILRTAIERYAAQHQGTPPGYMNGNPAQPNMMVFIAHLLKITDENHQIAEIGTDGYPFGPYIDEFPANPFNDFKTVRMIANDQDFPEATGEGGWLYKPQTKEIKIDWPGNDSKDKPFAEY